MGSIGKREPQKGLDCIVKGCKEIRRAKGLCANHAMAMRRYGNVLGGKIDRKGVCKECGEEFRLIKSDQEYCSGKCYRKSPVGRAAAYEATKAYRIRNREKVLAVGIFRRHPLKEGDNCLACGTKEKLHRHHHNYEKPRDVTVLCKDHHLELHNWNLDGVCSSAL